MKKKINIALLIVVFSLWGVVGYRFISNYFTASSKNVFATENTPLFKNLIIERDTFLLQAVTRDPFLNKLAPTTVTLNTFTKPKRIGVKRVRSDKPLVTLTWPDVRYFGYIKSGKNNELALVKLNGQLFRLRKGEKKNDILIYNVYNDSITVVFNKERKTFRKGI